MLGTVYVDFDGTIAPSDPTDTLFDRFCDPSWRDIELDWQQGRRTARECMARQVDLLRATPEAMDQLLRSVRIDPSFHDFVDLCRSWDLRRSRTFRRHGPCCPPDSPGCRPGVAILRQPAGVARAAIAGNWISPSHAMGCHSVARKLQVQPPRRLRIVGSASWSAMGDRIFASPSGRNSCWPRVSLPCTAAPTISRIGRSRISGTQRRFWPTGSRETRASRRETQRASVEQS